VFGGSQDFLCTHAAMVCQLQWRFCPLAGSDDTRTEREKMMEGDLYYSFAPKAPDLEHDRAKCRIKLAVQMMKRTYAGGRLLHLQTIPNTYILYIFRRTMRPVGLRRMSRSCDWTCWWTCLAASTPASGPSSSRPSVATT
jgi:hypothetical protein